MDIILIISLWALPVGVLGAIKKHKEKSKNQRATLEFTETKVLEPKLTSTKVTEMPMCGERKDLLRIQNIQAHQSSMVEIVSWLGHGMATQTNFYW